MSTIHLHQTTTLTPEQYIAGLTDFGPGRSKLFGNSADEYLKLHDRYAAYIVARQDGTTPEEAAKAAKFHIEGALAA